MSDLLQVLQGDALAVLRTLPDQSVHCCVTSPPYWGLRNYGVEGQIGLEATPSEYVAKMVEVFGEVRRVLRDDGTLWLNLGDSYNSRPCSNGRSFRRDRAEVGSPRVLADGLKEKDLVGIPWMTAFALRADGWYLRSDIIWHKPNPMPESVTDRPTKAHEYLFLLSKNAKYFYDAEAIKEQCSDSFLNDSRWDSGPTEENEKLGYAEAGAQNPKSIHRVFKKTKIPNGWDTDEGGHGTIHREGRGKAEYQEAVFDGRRNKRSVWTVPTFSFPDAHFATYPPELITPCILAGCPVGGTILDPFAGSGTTGQVALELGRKAVLIELNPAYIELIHQRTNVTPGFSNLHSQPPDGTPAEPVPPKTNQ